MAWSFLGVALIALLGISIGWWISHKRSGEILDDQPVQQALETAAQNPDPKLSGKQAEQWEKAQEFNQYLRQLWADLQNNIHKRREQLRQAGIQQYRENEDLMRITFLGEGGKERGRIEFTTLWVGLEKPEDTIPYVLFWDDIQPHRSTEQVTRELLDTLVEELKDNG